MTFLRACMVPLEIAHLGPDEVLHGHSLTIEVWTGRDTCLTAWRSEVVEGVAHIMGQLEITIGGGTFEDVGTEVLRVLPDATHVVVRLPTEGYSVEVRR